MSCPNPIGSLGLANSTFVSFTQPRSSKKVREIQSSGWVRSFEGGVSGAEEHHCGGNRSPLLHSRRALSLYAAQISGNNFASVLLCTNPSRTLIHFTHSI
ncbi:hypothetical protein PIB30_094632 [Stylosanthes scabra]|uniref:Uncharacterized protein n=1 Tax=Stylosanthes scabra TaxID=79078 RepID=A0ABU6VWF2_9FABA|nr:hypothetical protein [Stylosanthes scabra]